MPNISHRRAPALVDATRDHGRRWRTPAGTDRPSPGDGGPGGAGRIPTGGRGRRPGLDGLRGIALLGMMSWHAEVSWIRGGFARMTIFFALSGFLATRSYLRLVGDREGGTGWGSALRTFATRRIRRLLPVTVLGLVAATAVTLAAGSTDMRIDLRGDALSVVTYVSNWRFLSVNRSYGALFERPSAFQHFWSLSIEEQCLLALPLILALALAAGGRRRAAVVTGALAAAFGAIPAFVTHSPDAAYYGTHVRAGEFLAGAALALALDRWGGTVPAHRHRRVQVAGTAAMVGLGLVMLTVDRDLPWLYQGGLGLFSVPAVAVILAATEDRGPVTRVLGYRPLATIGRAAFPIYVLHWPLFVLVRRRLGPPASPMVAAEMVAALLIGLAAHRWFEKPLLPATGTRPSPRLGDGRVLGGAAAALAAIVAVVAIVPPPAPDYDFASAERRANTGRPATIKDERPAVALFGGSTAVSLGSIAFDWDSERHPPVRVEPGSSQLGCGVVTEGRRLLGKDLLRPDDYCLNWQQHWREAASTNGVVVTVWFGGVWETTDWELDQRPGTITNILRPDFRQLVRDRLASAADILSADGRHLLMATTPVIGPGESGHAKEDRGLGEDHAERVAVYNEIIREVVAERAGRVSVLDYAAVIDALDPATSATWMPDGIHPLEPAAYTLWDDVIGPAVNDAAFAAASARRAAPPETTAQPSGTPS